MNPNGFFRFLCGKRVGEKSVIKRGKRRGNVQIFRRFQIHDLHFGDSEKRSRFTRQRHELKGKFPEGEIRRRHTRGLVARREQRRFFKTVLNRCRQKRYDSLVCVPRNCGIGNRAVRRKRCGAPNRIDGFRRKRFGNRRHQHGKHQRARIVLRFFEFFLIKLLGGGINDFRDRLTVRVKPEVGVADAFPRLIKFGGIRKQFAFRLFLFHGRRRHYRFDEFFERIDIVRKDESLSDHREAIFPRLHCIHTGNADGFKRRFRIGFFVKSGDFFQIANAGTIGENHRIQSSLAVHHGEQNFARKNLGKFGASSGKFRKLLCGIFIRFHFRQKRRENLSIKLRRERIGFGLLLEFVDIFDFRQSEGIARQKFFERCRGKRRKREGGERRNDEGFHWVFHSDYLFGGNLKRRKFLIKKR